MTSPAPGAPKRCSLRLRTERAILGPVMTIGAIVLERLTMHAVRRRSRAGS